LYNNYRVVVKIKGLIESKSDQAPQRMPKKPTKTERLEAKKNKEKEEQAKKRKKKADAIIIARNQLVVRLGNVEFKKLEFNNSIAAIDNKIRNIYSINKESAIDANISNDFESMVSSCSYSGDKIKNPYTNGSLNSVVFNLYHQKHLLYMASIQYERENYGMDEYTLNEFDVKHGLVPKPNKSQNQYDKYLCDMKERKCSSLLVISRNHKTTTLDEIVRGFSSNTDVVECTHRKFYTNDYTNVFKSPDAIMCDCVLDRNFGLIPSDANFRILHEQAKLRRIKLLYSPYGVMIVELNSTYRHPDKKKKLFECVRDAVGQQVVSVIIVSYIFDMVDGWMSG
jgi:hypothetical protein